MWYRRKNDSLVNLSHFEAILIREHGTKSKYTVIAYRGASHEALFEGSRRQCEDELADIFDKLKEPAHVQIDGFVYTEGG